MTLEERGIPSAGVATEVFVEAAAAQSQSLGADPAYVFVAHPVQDRTDAELRALADGALDAILEKLQAQPNR